MKWKLSFLTGVPFIAGLFAIVFVSLGMVYFDRQNESRSLESQIALMRTTLRKPQPDLAALQTKLDAANAESDAVLTSLPNVEQGIDVYGALVELGRRSDIEIMSIEASAAVALKGGAGGKTILPYSISIRGSQENVLAFISSLADGQKLLQGVEMTDVNIDTASVDGSDTAELELNIHTWPDFNAPTPEPTPTPKVKK